ncbi:MAG TPA: type II secretion system protein [Candidatus Paceibacterota bacterium]
MYPKNQSGFTLIELLVVIAIISILSSVVLASLSTARAKARDAKTKSDIHQIKLALYLARDASSDGRFPGVANTWQCLKPSGTCGGGEYSGNSTITSALAPFMPTIPKPYGPPGSYMYDAYLYYPYHPGGFPVGTYILYALEADSSPSSCVGYFVGALEAGYYYCIHLIEPN